MEKNQQNSSQGKSIENETQSFDNRLPDQQSSANNETENSNRFAETSDSKEQHSERSSPEAENETLGTP